MTGPKQFFIKLRPLFKNFWLFALILTLMAATQVALFLQPVVGTYVNAATFALLFSLALWNKKLLPLCLAAAILPVVNMVSLALPRTTAFTQTIVFYAGIFTLGLIYRLAFTLDFPAKNTKLTVRGYIVYLASMFVAGEALGAIGYGMLRHQFGFGHISLIFIAPTVVFFAIAEETLFRGLIQQRAMQVLHPGVAAVLSALLFAVFTFGHTGSWLAPLFGLILGTALAVTYAIKQNLILTITMNATSKLVYIGILAATGTVLHF